MQRAVGVFFSPSPHTQSSGCYKDEHQTDPVPSQGPFLNLTLIHLDWLVGGFQESSWAPPFPPQHGGYSCTSLPGGTFQIKPSLQPLLFLFLRWKIDYSGQRTSPGERESQSHDLVRFSAWAGLMFTFLSARSVWRGPCMHTAAAVRRTTCSLWGRRQNNCGQNQKTEYGLVLLELTDSV